AGDAARRRVLPDHGAAHAAPMGGVLDSAHLCFRCAPAPARPWRRPKRACAADPACAARSLANCRGWFAAVALGGRTAAARLSRLRARHRAGATEWDVDTMAMTTRGTSPQGETGGKTNSHRSAESGDIIAVRGIGKLYPRPGGGRRALVPVLRDIEL